MTSLVATVFVELTTRLMANAVPKSKTPAIIKSGNDQSNPCTKRLQKNAAAKSNAGRAKMRMCVCFNVFIFYLFQFTKHFEIQSLNSKKFELYLPNNFSSAFKCSVNANLPACVTR